jgi:hypothetical protein
MTREKLQASLRSLLLPDAFTGAGAVKQLMALLDEYGMQEVEVPIRMDILTRVRDNAGNNYFRAWCENTDAMDLTREWLKAGVKGDGQASETVMPLLHVSWTFIEGSLACRVYEKKFSLAYHNVSRIISDNRSPATYTRVAQRVEAREDCHEARQGPSDAR